MNRYIDPRHGTHAPTTGTPARRPGSVRRTTTVDALRLRRPGPVIHGPDACAGFQVGGVIMSNLDTGGGANVTGPDATPLSDPGDPVGWHDMASLPVDAMRRWRRNDLWRDADGILHVDILFRDSHMAPGDVETIIHEYTVEATVGADMRVTACVATPRVLPWAECPQAAASAGRVVGMAVMGLRPQVRAELLGPSTCTHLNDTLREIEDVVALAELLPIASGA
jgi:hypothetical protein